MRDATDLIRCDGLYRALRNRQLLPF